MEIQKTIIPRAKIPLRTSNETIFPSLHPFGNHYRQKQLYHKRSLETVSSPDSDLEPSKKLHTSDIEPDSMANVLIHPQTENYSSFALGRETNDIRKDWVASSLLKNFSVVPTVVNPVKKPTTIIVQAQQSQLENFQSPSQFKKLQRINTVSDISTTDNDTEEETQSSKENTYNTTSGVHNVKIDPLSLLHHTILKEMMLGGRGLDQRGLRSENSPFETLRNIPINENPLTQAKAEETEMQVKQEETCDSSPQAIEKMEERLGGLTPRIEESALMGLKPQNQLPSFKLCQGNFQNEPKLMWAPQENKMDKADILMHKMTMLLRTEMANKEMMARLFKENGLLFEDNLAMIQAKTNRLKLELMGKKN